MSDCLVISSFCNYGGCAAVGLSQDGMVQLYDTKDLGQPPLAFTREEWGAFITEVKAGHYDPA